MRYALVGLCLALSGVAYAAQPMETREIVLQCSGLTVRVNPMTSVAHVSYNMGYEYFRTRGAVDPHFIVIEPTLWGKVRIDREAMTYSMVSCKRAKRQR